jgi:hypothetical protein
MFGMTVRTAQAGPFEKAGLTKSTGRTLSDQQADKVRGGFRGGMDMSAVLEVLGIDPSLDRDAVRTQLQALGRDAVRAAIEEAGIDIQRPAGGQRPELNGQPPSGMTPLEGMKRGGFRNRSAMTGRRAARAR